MNVYQVVEPNECYECSVDKIPLAFFVHEADAHSLAATMNEPLIYAQHVVHDRRVAAYHQYELEKEALYAAGLKSTGLTHRYNPGGFKQNNIGLFSVEEIEVHEGPI